MTPNQPAAFWRGLRRWLPGIAISAVALWLVLRSVTWQDVGKALSEINPWTLALVLGIYIIAMSLRAMCWWTILQHRVKFSRAFFVMNEGYLLNNVFPLRIGELGRAFILGRSSGLGFLQVLSTIVVERSYDLATAASLLLGTLPMVLALRSSGEGAGMEWTRTVAWIILALVAAGLVGLFVIARYRQPFMQWAAKAAGRFAFIQNWVLPKVSAILDGFAVLTRPGAFVISFALMAASWILAIFEEYLILRDLVPTASLWWLAFVLGVSAIGAGVPSVAGAIGVYEAAVVGALSLLGVDPAKGLAFALIIHLIQLGMSSLFGVIGLFKEGESLASLYQSLTAKKSQPA
jgi:glycosyltransferase 2 family protein